VDLEAGGARQRPSGCGDEAKAVPGRRSSRATTIKIFVACTLAAGTDRLDIGVRFENTAIQHRLRLAFRLDKYQPVISGCHFSALPRGWQEGTSFFTTFPFTDYIHLGDEKDAIGLAFMANGLHEAEIRFAAGQHDLLVTLCRSVDTISGANSGLNYDVEHGKLLAPLSFELALSPSRSLVETARKAMAFTTPTLVSGTLLSGDSIPAAPPIKSFSSGGTLFSCLKPTASGAGFVVRCFNLTGKPESAVIECNGEPGPVRRVELSESDSSKAQPVIVGRKVIQAIGPHEIVTIRFGGG
jgi:alpha-mannosidase